MSTGVIILDWASCLELGPGSLRQALAADAAMAVSFYRPLDETKDEIRLLIIQPGSDLEGPINYEIIPASRPKKINPSVAASHEVEGERGGMLPDIYQGSDDVYIV